MYGGSYARTKVLMVAVGSLLVVLICANYLPISVLITKECTHTTTLVRCNSYPFLSGTNGSTNCKATIFYSSFGELQWRSW